MAWLLLNVLWLAADDRAEKNTHGEMTQRSIVNRCYYTGKHNLLNRRLHEPIQNEVPANRSGSSLSCRYL